MHGAARGHCFPIDRDNEVEIAGAAAQRLEFILEVQKVIRKRDNKHLRFCFVFIAQGWSLLDQPKKLWESINIVVT